MLIYCLYFFNVLDNHTLMSIDGLIPLLTNQKLLKSLESLSIVLKVQNLTKKYILNLLDLEIKNLRPKKKKLQRRHLNLKKKHLKKRLQKNQMQLILFWLLNPSPAILLMLFLKGMYYGLCN